MQELLALLFKQKLGKVEKLLAEGKSGMAGSITHRTDMLSGSFP